MTLNLAYLIGTLLFGVILVAAVSTQIFDKRFHPFLYWAVVVATTTVGRRAADRRRAGGKAIGHAASAASREASQKDRRHARSTEPRSVKLPLLQRR
jgi:uncharacterized membrane-anchored protein